jgi:hypothetical protein
LVFHKHDSTLSGEVSIVKLLITLKQTDADGVGGELLETLGMNRAKRDHKSFVKELAVTELLERFSRSVEDEEEEEDGKDVEASAGAFAGRRRRRRRRVRPTDFLLYEDNSLYALPYLEPLTDRGIIPLRVSLRTDSTVALTPINASTVSADKDVTNEDHIRHNKAVRLLDDGVDRLQKKGEVRNLTSQQKENLMHEIADEVDEDDVPSASDIDEMVLDEVNGSTDEELAEAALALAANALKNDVRDDAVVEAIRQAAFALSKE